MDRRILHTRPVCRRMQRVSPRWLELSGDLRGGPHASDPIPGLSWEAQLWGGGASGAKGQVDAALTSLKAIAGGHLSEVGFTRA